MYAVQRDIRHHERLNNDDQLDQATRDDAGQYVLDLTAVLGELGMAYKMMQPENPEFPELDTLVQQLEAL